jgi:hypothetical protein
MGKPNINEIEEIFYKGSIKNAINQSKIENKDLLIYIQGKEESSINLLSKLKEINELKETTINIKIEIGTKGKKKKINKRIWRVWKEIQNIFNSNNIFINKKWRSKTFIRKSKHRIFKKCLWKINRRKKNWKVKKKILKGNKKKYWKVKNISKYRENEEIVKKRKLKLQKENERIEKEEEELNSPLNKKKSQENNFSPMFNFKKKIFKDQEKKKIENNNNTTTIIKGKKKF